MRIINHGRSRAEERLRVGVVGAVSRVADVVRRRCLIIRRRAECQRVQHLIAHAEIVLQGWAQQRRARQVQTQVAFIADEIEEVAIARREDDQRQARLIAVNAADLPAADQPVNHAAFVQVAFAFAERQLDDVVEDDNVRRVVRRHRLQRLDVERVLQDTAYRRRAEEVFGGVRQQLRPCVREDELDAARKAPIQLDLQSVVPALAFAFEQVVDAPILRERL